MDYQKDAQKNEGIVKFVDAQSGKTNPFGENRVGERAYRRAEKIGAAVLLLTSHVSDTDPLRIRARQVAIALLEAVLAVRAEMRSPNSEKIAELKVAVRELISLVRMLAVAGSVSLQNAAVVVEALDELSGFVSASQRSSLSERAVFSKDDFLDVREQSHGHPANRAVQEVSLISAHTLENEDTHASSTVREQKTYDKGRDKDAPKTVSAPFQSASPVRGESSRARAIMEVLRITDTELGIRDIAAHLPEFSEKMIQRELAVLVQKGTVRKTGEKRWSRYARIVA